MTDLISNDVWQQDGPVGGTDLDGEPPAVAVATVAAGITTVREVPALRSVSGAYPLTQGAAAVRLVGDEGRRRRIIVSVRASAVAGARVVLSDDPNQAAAGFGLEIPAGMMVTLRLAGELYAATFAADLTVSFLAELDQG